MINIRNLINLENQVKNSSRICELFFRPGIFYWFVDTETNTVRSDKVKKAIKILIDFSFICILVVGVRHILIEYSSSAAVHPSTATGGFSSL